MSERQRKGDSGKENLRRAVSAYGLIILEVDKLKANKNDPEIVRHCRDAISLETVGHPELQNIQSAVDASYDDVDSLIAALDQEMAKTREQIGTSSDDVRVVHRSADSSDVRIVPGKTRGPGDSGVFVSPITDAREDDTVALFPTEPADTTTDSRTSSKDQAEPTMVRIQDRGLFSEFRRYSVRFDPENVTRRLADGAVCDLNGNLLRGERGQIFFVDAILKNIAIYVPEAMASPPKRTIQDMQGRTRRRWRDVISLAGAAVVISTLSFFSGRVSKEDGEIVKKDESSVNASGDTSTQPDIVQSIEDGAKRGETIELTEGVSVTPRSDGTLEVEIENPELLVDIYFSGRDQNGQALPKEWGCTMNTLTRSIVVPQKFRGPDVRTMVIIATSRSGDANSTYAKEWHEVKFPNQ